MIRLIALDLGGTLLNDDGSIPNENLEAIAKAKANGVKIVLATARMYSSTRYISNQIGADYGVFGNGSVLSDLVNLRTLRKESLSLEAILEIVKLARKNKLYIHLNYEFEEVSDELDFFAKKHTILNEKYPPDLKSNILVVSSLERYIKSNPLAIKIILVSENSLDFIMPELKKIINKFHLHLTENYSNTFENIINKNVNYLEIGSSGENKAMALKELINSIGVNEDEVMVFGDGLNDIEMLESFVNSVCMANGNERIKSKAYYVTSRNNNEAGVAEAINKLVLSKK